MPADCTGYIRFRQRITTRKLVDLLIEVDIAKHRVGDPFMLASSTTPSEASTLVTCKKEANNKIIIQTIKFFSIRNIIGHFSLNIKFPLLKPFGNFPLFIVELC